MPRNDVSSLISTAKYTDGYCIESRDCFTTGQLLSEALISPSDLELSSPNFPHNSPLSWPVMNRFYYLILARTSLRETEGILGPPLFKPM
jgi:hypothetical protein